MAIPPFLNSFHDTVTLNSIPTVGNTYTADAAAVLGIVSMEVHDTAGELGDNFLEVGHDYLTISLTFDRPAVAGDRQRKGERGPQPG